MENSTIVNTSQIGRNIEMKGYMCSEEGTIFFALELGRASWRR